MRCAKELISGMVTPRVCPQFAIYVIYNFCSDHMERSHCFSLRNVCSFCQSLIGKKWRRRQSFDTDFWDVCRLLLCALLSYQPLSFLQLSLGSKLQSCESEGRGSNIHQSIIIVVSRSTTVIFVISIIICVLEKYDDKDLQRFSHKYRLWRLREETGKI